MAANTETTKPASGLSVEHVAKMIGGKVTVVKTDKHGKPVRIPTADKDGNPVAGGGRFETEQVAVRAEHILSYRQYPDRVVAVTIDGQKHEKAAA